MKFLIDTNIFIPLEPSSLDDVEVLSPDAARMHRLIQQGGHQVFLHPKSRIDINEDKNDERRELRLRAFEKYPHLEGTVSPFIDFTMIVGESPLNSNSEIDNHLIFAVYNNAVDFFVSEDRGVHAKARRLGIESKVFRMIDVIRMLEKLSASDVAVVFPSIEMVKAYAVNPHDPIFDSLRDGYPGFDKWFAKCQTCHRNCFVVSEGGELDAVCILKDETSGEYGMTGKVLKVCTFKVGNHASGHRYGELMLKAVLSHAYNNGYEWVYVTAFEDNERISVFLDTFGFSDADGFKTSLGENVFKRRLHPLATDYGCDSLDFHIHFGPKYVAEDCLSYVVPIMPQYHRLLFPELERQADLFVEKNPFGNSILKAYLCHSNVKELKAGSLMFFYRSDDSKTIQAVGVVEASIRSADPTTIVSHVGKRTVYSLSAIKRMCHKEVLAVLFRQANGYEAPIPRKILEKQNVFSRPPQSISNVNEEGHKWLLSQKRV